MPTQVNLSPDIQVKNLKKLSVVIPVFNAENHIERTVKQFIDLDEVVGQIICVDDCSKDRSLELLEQLREKDPRIEIFKLEKNSGAGVARNYGFEHVKSEFVYFFDADDVLNPKTLLKAVSRAENTKAELVLCGYHLGEIPEDKGPMHRLDAETCNRFLGSLNWTVMNSKDIASFLVTTNYPWTKILRTSYAKHIGLKFGATKVHNDILGHWISLLYAKRMVLMRDSVCTHIVPAGGGNLTNIRDNRRLGVFEALSDLDAILDREPSLRDTAFVELIKFKIIVLKWARSNIGHDYLYEFDNLAQRAFENIDMRIYLKLEQEWPNLAKDMIKLRFGS